MASHSERDFENAIEAELTGSGGYEARSHSAYDETLALFPEDITGFLQDSQPSKWTALEALLGPKTATTILSSLSKELDLKGTLHVLRHGFKCYGKTLRVAYFQPNTRMNPEAAAQYAKNRLTITRQVGFTSVLKRPDGQHRRCIIDLTLAVNGLPVATAELKNPLTGQRAADAVRQYQQERDARDLLFAFKQRALVHFAVDPDEVWMTTRLNGKDTHFLPFNRGHAQGAGNPPVEGNWKTHYLWDEVLHADSLLEILQRFMHLEVKETPIKTVKGTRTLRKETLIFPRYQQRDAVRTLVAQAKAHGSGHNYLIKHSAGSGKSNTIAWLAHRLATLHDAQDEKVFHSVVVVTDRLVLDQQLQATIYQFEHKTGVVEKIDEDSQQLARALSQGTPIVITTIQKFPFIAQALSTLEKQGTGVQIDTAGKRFAVIVDEAHSSQSGETAVALKGMLNKDGIEAVIAAQFLDEEAEEGEDDDLSNEAKIASLRAALKRGRQPNLSFFAFTATPKFKTLALFDEPGPTGMPPFHEYSMRQAIEEGFILDVLAHYTSYQRFYGLIKQIEDDPEVPRRKAAKALSGFLELHPVNIAQIVTVIVEHFRRFVLHELGGRAKAMVVTGSRLAAVRYKRAFDLYIQDQGYSGIRSLVAFSGTVEDPDDPGASYTEVAMNDGLAERELPETFERDDYRVLLVAEKYQTGFDQPLLQTMYVVKRLSGVQAVQTLSRLNRTAPGKSRTFVLDFINQEDDIYRAFKPYYETTPIGENANPHRLSELQHHLLEWAIFTAADVSAFAAIWYRPKRDHSARDHQAMHAVLDAVVRRFEDREDKDREQFRSQLTAYRNLYAFLSQIIPYQDSDLERLYAFVRNLLAKLPARGDGQAFVLDDEVALRFFRLQQMTEGSIDLGEGNTYPLKGPTDLGTGGIKDEAVPLSSLIDRLNERFGTDFNEADQLFFDQIRASAERNETISEAARANSFSNFAAYLDRTLDELFIARMEGNEEIFNRVMTDTAFRSAAREHLAREIFESVREV
ncbi:MAG: DEAD/DEAH box helicase family protein [Chromatiaceae bacterium]|nr:DEAD/DEAH box helicase family protein [Chromatiaceae bacterium]